MPAHLLDLSAYRLRPSRSTSTRGSIGLLPVSRSNAALDPSAGTIFVFLAKGADQPEASRVGRQRAASRLKAVGKQAIPLAVGAGWLDAVVAGAVIGGDLGARLAARRLARLSPSLRYERLS